MNELVVSLSGDGERENYWRHKRLARRRVFDFCLDAALLAGFVLSCWLQARP